MIDNVTRNGLIARVLMLKGEKGAKGDRGDINIDGTTFSLPVLVANGGTGAITAEGARNNLGLGDVIGQLAGTADSGLMQSLYKSIEDESRKRMDAIEDESKKRMDADRVLESSIGNIVASAGTDGSSSSEVADIRTAYDGCVYTSAGNSVRGQAGNLADMIGGVAKRKSYIDVGSLSSGLVYGKVGDKINTPSGTAVNHLKFAVTPGARYEVTRPLPKSATYYYMFIYVDSSDVIVGSETIGSSEAKNYTHVTVAPQNASYMYANTSASSTANVTVAVINGYDNLKYQLDTANGTADAKIGAVPVVGDETQLAIDNGGIGGSIGHALEFGTQTYWRHASANVNAGEMYRVVYRQNANANIAGYVYFADSSNRIIGIYGKPEKVLEAIKTIDVTVPYGASKMYIQSFFRDTVVASATHITGYNSLQNQIDSIENRLSGDHLPDYYAGDWLSNHISAIKNQTKVINGVSFAFITDMHFADNSKNSKYMLKEILDSTSVPFVICGGDFPIAYGDETMVREAGSKLLDYQAYIGNDRFFSIRGNHDFTSKTSASAATGLTLPIADTYDYICRAEEWHVGGMLPDHMCFWLDNAAQKTRIICLNSCDGQSDNSTQPWGVYYSITQEQVDWLVNEALDISGYRVIFVSHVPADPKLSSYSDTQDVLHGIMKALKKKTTYSASGSINVSVDYSKTDLDVICHIVGHSHKDESNSDEGLISISTTCDAHYQDDNIERKAGTVSEQAFDVFTIDFDSKKISAHRVGAGNDRNWTY